MEAHLVVPPSSVAPLGAATTVGRAGADVVVDEPTVSRMHLRIEHVGGGWLIEDLGSRNGTFVNGTRVLGVHALHDGDEIRAGRVPLGFRCSSEEMSTPTSPLGDAPRITRRERDLLVALCRPMLEGSVLSPPPSLEQLVADLAVGESAVKKLLGRTYDRFGLVGRDRRRVNLAMEALSRGVVRPTDLH